MGILDIFKRKDHFEDLELSKDPPKDYDFSMHEQPAPPGPNYGDPYTQPQQQMQQSHGSDQLVAKELEIISSKLDSIRATLESLNQRISGLERVAYGDQNYGRRY